MNITLFTSIFWGTHILTIITSLIFAILALRTKHILFTYLTLGVATIGVIQSTFPTESAPGLSAVIISITGMALAVLGGGPIVSLALHIATRNSMKDTTSPNTPTAENTSISNETRNCPSTYPPTFTPHDVLRGGLMIGILERLAIAGTIVVGIPEGVAVVIAIKGVGRFTELASAETRERFIIGTLASVVWASAIAAMIRFTTT